MDSETGDRLPESVTVPVPHLQQKYSWDCGLACVLMILEHYQKNAEGFKELCNKLDFGESVWTIDLANLLKHFNIRSHLCTILKGVNKGYSKQSFYQARFTADEKRVNKLFEEHKTLGLSVEERSVNIEEILQHVSQNQIAIVLLDWSVLYGKMLTDTVKCLPGSCIGKCNTSYQGHFVVLCGYNKKEKVVYFQNPALSSTDMSVMNKKTFDAARKSYGTDEDILFIYNS